MENNQISIFDRHLFLAVPPQDLTGVILGCNSIIHNNDITRLKSKGSPWKDF